VPTTAAYLICVSVAGPALMQLGLEAVASASLCVLVLLYFYAHAAGLVALVFIAMREMIGEKTVAACRNCDGTGCGFPFTIIPAGK